MPLDDLWFDVAIRGEHDLGKDAIVRLHLLDGREPGPKGDKPQMPPPAPESTGERQSSFGADLA
jgi:hypothetical protein